MFEAKPQPADANEKMATPQVAQGAPGENQRTQKQTLRLDHPLHIHHCRMEATLYRRQSDVDDCAVDECHAGTENRCSKNPWSGSFSTRDCATAKSEYGFIARRSHENMDAIKDALGPKNRSRTCCQESLAILSVPGQKSAWKK